MMSSTLTLNEPTIKMIATAYRINCPNLSADEAVKITRKALASGKNDPVAREFAASVLTGAAVQDLILLSQIIRRSNEPQRPSEERHKEYIKWLANAAAVFVGHFELLGGDHSSQFFRFSRVAGVREYADQAGADLGTLLSGLKPTRVFGPVTAGGLLVYPLCKKFGASAGYFDIVGRYPAMVREGYELGSNEKVLLVNDMITIGTGMGKMVEMVQRARSKVVGIALFATRGDRAIDALRSLADKAGVPCASLIHLDLPSWSPDSCPLCGTGNARPILSFAVNT
jgi:orotate phosphoribosyltransferase